MKSLLTLAFLTICFTTSAQEAEWATDEESFERLPKGTLRREAAQFSTFAENEKNSTVKLSRIPFKKRNGNTMIFGKDSISVIIKRKPFVKSKYKLQYKDGFIHKINNKFYYGTDGGMPSEAFQSVELIRGTDTLRVPQQAFADLFQPSFCDEDEHCGTDIYVSADRRRIYIFSTNSDAAGAYEVTWIFQDRKYLRRILDSGY